MGEFITPFVSAAAYQISGRHTDPRAIQSRADKARIAEVTTAVDTLLRWDGYIVMTAAIEIARAARRGHRLPVWAAIRIARSVDDAAGTATRDPLHDAASNGPRYFTRSGPIPAGVSDGRARAFLDLGVVV